MVMSLHPTRDGTFDLLSGLRAAGEPSRLRLLGLCAQGELTVSELTQILGQSQPRVSRHLKLLCEAGLLERFREGTWAFYRTTEQGEGAELTNALIGLMREDQPVHTRDQERLAAVKAGRAEAAQAYFRANAAEWHKIRALYVPEAEVERALLDLFAEIDIAEFLDIGTGTARMVEVFGPRIRRGVGLDLSHEMLALARANLERAGLSHCQVRHGDMYAISFADKSFDAVLFHQVLHFAGEPARAIAESARVLKPGGHLAVVDFAPHDQEFLRTEQAHRRLGFTDEEVAGWYRAAGLTVGEPVRLAGDPLTVVIWPAAREAEEAAVPARAVFGE